MTWTLEDRLRAYAEEPHRYRRPALVVQGGGLRGVYSMGALAALEEAGLRDAFAHVVGSSAGAINGAYFLAGQARESVSIYYEQLSTSKFVSPLRPLKIVDVDYMVDTALKQHHLLDVRAMLDAPAELHTILTDAESAELRIVSNRTPGIDPYELFRATAALPGLYNRKISIDDSSRTYVDGGLAGLVPLDEAFTHADEVVVLLTRAEGHRRSDRGVAFQLLVRTLMHGQSAQVRRKVCAADLVYNTAMERLDREQEQSPRATWTLRPSQVERLVNRTTSDPVKLRDCAALAYDDMLELLRRRELRPQPHPALLHRRAS